MLLRPFAAALLGTAAALAPCGASAELVTLTSGQTLSVKRVHVQAGTAVLQLRGGGEMSCAASLIVRVMPDEVPYPEPVALVAQDSAAAAVLASPEMPALPESSVIPGAYSLMVADAARRHQVDPRLVHAVISVESRYRPWARSRKGAMGLMQLMPDTARDLHVRDPYDPASNIDGGVRHLRRLLDRFDVGLALAAYNAGAAAVDKFRGVPPYRETQAYVRQVLHLAGLH